MGARGMTPPPRTELPEGGGMVGPAQGQMPARTAPQAGGKGGGMPPQVAAILQGLMRQRQAPQGYSPTGVQGGPQANFQNSMNAMRAIQSQGPQQAPSMPAPWIAQRAMQPAQPSAGDIDARIAAALQQRQQQQQMPMSLSDGGGGP